MTGKELRAQLPDDDHEVYIEAGPSIYHRLNQVRLTSPVKMTLRDSDAEIVVLSRVRDTPEWTGLRAQAQEWVGQRTEALESLWGVVQSGNVAGMTAAIERLNELEQP